MSYKADGFTDEPSERFLERGGQEILDRDPMVVGDFDQADEDEVPNPARARRKVARAARAVAVHEKRVKRSKDADGDGRTGAAEEKDDAKEEGSVRPAKSSLSLSLAALAGDRVYERDGDGKFGSGPGQPNESGGGDDSEGDGDEPEEDDDPEKDARRDAAETDRDDAQDKLDAAENERDAEADEAESGASDTLDSKIADADEKVSDLESEHDDLAAQKDAHDEAKRTSQEAVGAALKTRQTELEQTRALLDDPELDASDRADIEKALSAPDARTDILTQAQAELEKGDTDRAQELLLEAEEYEGAPENYLEVEYKGSSADHASNAQISAADMSSPKDVEKLDKNIGKAREKLDAAKAKSAALEETRAERAAAARAKVEKKHAKNIEKAKAALDEKQKALDDVDADGDGRTGAAEEKDDKKEEGAKS